MPRAKRYYMEGLIWHITHRCHQKKFSLKFLRDRRCWIQWLYEACKRYGLSVLNYCVTCNHIHLLVYDKGCGEIPRSMQLIAGCTGQAYNKRKEKEGAFWDDRYHATAVDTENHLLRCCSYIDFNMIRAGVVTHPDEWPACGYREIINGKERYKIIDRDMLSKLMIKNTPEKLGEIYKAHTDELITAEYVGKREPEWTESIAVGSDEFIDSIKSKITHIRTAWKNRTHTMSDGTSILCDKSETYNDKYTYSVDFGGEMGTLRAKNDRF